MIVTTTWYRTWLAFNEIVPVEIERSTENSVWIKERRVQRTGSYQEYWPTWEEAHARLVKAAEDDLVQARLALQRAEGRLGNIRGMRSPVNGT